MRTRDIMLMTLLFVTCFLVTEIVITRFIIAGPVIRFILRVVLLMQYTLVIKYLFEFFEKTDEIDSEASRMPEPSGHSAVKEQTANEIAKQEEDGRKNDGHSAGSTQREA